MIYVFKDLPVSAIHTCPDRTFSGCIYLHEQRCWAYSGSNVFSEVLIPGIKYCPYCGEKLEQE